MSKSKNEKIFNEKIKEAFDLYLKRESEADPSEEELSKITFSEEFERKMQKLIARQKKFYFYLINTAAKRVAMLVAVLLAALTTMTFSVKALREPFIDFVVKTFEKFTSIVFNVDDEADNDNNSDIIIPFVKKVPTYIPEGYLVDFELTTETLYQCMYKDTTGKTIAYAQNYNDGSSAVIDTEGSYYEKVNINSLECMIYENKGELQLVFSTNEYVFTIRGSVTKNEIIKIAESIPLN